VGFLDEEDGFFKSTADRGLIAGAVIGARQQALLRKLAEQFASGHFLSIIDPGQRPLKNCSIRT